MQHTKAKYPKKTSLIYNDNSFSPVIYIKTNTELECFDKNGRIPAKTA